MMVSVHRNLSGLSPEESTLHLLSHMYAIRSMSLWKSSSLSAWLVSTAFSMLPTFSSKCGRPIRARFLRVFTSEHLRESIYRHVIVLAQTHAQQEHRVLTAFIPRQVLNAHQYACDPLPPQTACSLYDNEFFATAEDSVLHRAIQRRTRAEERQMELLVPDAATRERVFELYDILINGEHMPGGVVRFAQELLQRPDEFIEMLRNVAGLDEFERAPQNVEEMPGWMDGIDDDDGVEDVPVVNLPQTELSEAGHESAVDGEREQSEDEEDVDIGSLAVSVHVLPVLWSVILFRTVLAVAHACYAQLVQPPLGGCWRR